jgi:DNA polymerase-1
MSITPPPSPRLFLVDGYALIYRAFFALISRPLTTARGENTSAAWGIANFLNRLVATHKPDYLGWVHDSGLSFRHETYPEYKATREKLTEELQSDFDRGMERICQMLDAWRIPILKLEGYEADDVIGTLAKKGAEAGLNVVIVSGDKDFQQLVAPKVWLLNPGRGGPAAVDEQWVGMENATDRLGVPPERVVDYLALVGDTSDNVPGVKGIGDKGAVELVNEFGSLENILENVEKIAKKRPREALQAQSAEALLSKDLVTIRCDLAMPLDLEAMRLDPPDVHRLRDLFVELEFHSLARQLGDLPPTPGAPAVAAPQQEKASYETIDTVQGIERIVRRARKAKYIAIDTETILDPDVPVGTAKVDALRSRLVGISIALAPGEAYYLPLAHRLWSPAQAELALGIDDGGGETVTAGGDDGVIGEAGGAPQGSSDGETGETTESEDGRAGASAVAAKKKAAKKKAASPADLLATAGIAGRMLAEKAWPVKNLPPLASAEMRPFVELLEDPTVRKTAQNAKYDLLVFRRAGVEVKGFDFDPMLASYVLDPGRRSHGLDVLALEFLDYVMTTYDDLCGRGRQQLPFDVVPIPCATAYSAEDADITLRLRERFEPMLAEQQLLPLLQEIEVPLVCVLADMEEAGIAIDLARFQALKARFAAERQRVEKEIYEAAGEEFNINSNPKLRAILFEKLGLPVLKKTATGPSTDATVLQQLADEGHALPVLLMEYRELSKLESTYIDALPAIVDPRDGRIHTSFNQTVASTGRLSSSDPNLQNIPIRRELGQEIRRGFVPRKGWKLFAADYSQIELRLLAHLSQDPAFVEAFRAGGDIHRQTASIIFGVPLESVTKEMRARAKTINFATIYGQGAHALSRQLKIANAEAREFITLYFERFAGVRRYLDAQVDQARELGYVETIFKRRRYIPELRERNFNIRAFGERVAGNAPIQGSAADLIKVAMIRIHDALAAAKLSAKMLLQVHDELVFEVPVPELAQVEALVRREMEGAATLSVPLVVEVGVGDDWMDTKL